MKLKYYLRGLGAGMIVTAILMGVAASKHTKMMSDAEIMARAEELGMVKSTVLSADLETEEPEMDDTLAPTVSDNTADAVAEADVSSDDTDEVKDDVDKSDDSQKSDQDAQEALDTLEQAEADAKAKEEALNQKEEELLHNDASDTSVNAGSAQVVTINSGDGSFTVANKLQQLGVINDAKAFDTYLCTNGYDKRLTTGKHDIPANATNQQIAEALVKKGY